MRLGEANSPGMAFWIEFARTMADGCETQDAGEVNERNGIRQSVLR